MTTDALREAPMTTPDRSTLLDLIAKLEAATGPDRKLDAEIAIALLDAPKLASGKKVKRIDLRASEEGYVCHNAHLCYSAEPYTVSIDDAVVLLDRILPGAWYVLARGKTRADEPLYGARILFGDTSIGDGEHDAKQAIALCIALIKALIAGQSDKESKDD